MTDTVKYDDIFEKRNNTIESRDAAMDFVDSYYYEPGNVSSISSHLDKLLAPNSAYLREAKDRSRKEREAQGYLNSGFNEGIGETVAIDKAFDVAAKDVYAEAYNVNQTNTIYNKQYKRATQFATNAQAAQGSLDKMQLGYENFLDSMAKNQELSKELMSDAFSYESSLQDLSHDHEMEREYLKDTNAIANRIMRDKSGLQKFYLSQYSQIMMSDIDPEDKKAQLEGLGKNVDSITNAVVNARTMQIGENPYTINGIEYAQAYTPTDNGEAFVWTLNDADWVWQGEGKDVINNLRDQIYAQTNGEQRDQYAPWYQVNDVIWTEFPQLRSKDPQAYEDIMQWFNKTGKNQLQDDWKGVINKWANATRYYPSHPPRAPFRVFDDYEYFNGEKIVEPYDYTVWAVNADKTDIVAETRTIPGNAAYYDREEWRAAHPFWRMG